MTTPVALAPNALSVAEKRYLQRDEAGGVVETPEEMFRRVAHNVALANERYDDGRSVADDEEAFFDLMASLAFLPNSPTLMNAGTEIQQLAACFTLAVPDSIEGIFSSLRSAALIWQSGGGTGYNFSRLRPRGDIVRSTGGVASGPVSFMRIFDVSTESIKQGGRRRGANMGILRVDHPDIEEFVRCKADGAFANFNLSVSVPDAFMEQAERGEPYALLHPQSGEVVGEEGAARLFDLIAEMAWETGDPGLIFLDRIEGDNPTPALGTLDTTNPCGEQPLLPYEACNLGSVNLVRMLTGKWGDRRLDWDRLESTVRTAVRFLDNVIDMSQYPLDEITELVRGNRKIGLGLMGWADVLIEMGIPYDTPGALDLARRVMKRVRETADDESRRIGKARGSFPNVDESVYDPPMRNATRTTIAPTGTISLLADVSSGIEPLYAITYVRRIEEGDVLTAVNPYFEEMARQRGFHSEALMERVARRHSIRDLEEVPRDVRRLFVTAHDIAPEWHVKHQAAFQEFVDNAVSKTVNLRQRATQADVSEVYRLAWKLGCKGITVYREGSKEEQPLSLEDQGKEICPDCGGHLGAAEGSFVCQRCGFSEPLTVTASG